MAKDLADTRALKDAAADHLRQSRFDKAAEVLEELVRLEPDEMQHRLRLGDCYRRLKAKAQAIAQYDTVGRHYADEDQFIKAIAAFKVVLEIDPGNSEAREQLSRMNDRRVSTRRPAKATPLTPGAETLDAIELPDASAAAPRIPTDKLPDYGRELVFDEEAEQFSTGKRSSDVIERLPTDKLERLPTGAILIAAADGPLARSIADLLSTDVESEIDLLSFTSETYPDDDPPPPQEDAITEVVEEAISAIAATTAKRRKLPTRVPLFDDLPRDAFFELVNRLSHHRYAAGEQILAEGEAGRSFFVIVEGKVRIWKKLPDGSELDLATLDEGAFFGEMALLSGAPRAANVSAESDTELLEIGDTVLRELSSEHPHIAQSLKNFYRRRLLNNVIAISPLFKDFDTAHRRRLVEKFRLRQVASGEILIKEGTPSDGLYVVLQGAVEVAAKQIPLAKLREGDIFGEMSLLKRQPATATVVSSGSSIVLRLAKEHFQELIVTHPQILALVSELTEQRSAATRAALERRSISSFV